MAGVQVFWSLSAHLALIDGESLDGYVARVAAQNHILNVFEITRIAGAVHHNLANAAWCHPDSLAELADFLGMDLKIIRYLAVPLSADGYRRTFLGAEINRRLLSQRVRYFSPASLKQSPHHRVLWMLRCFPFCEESWEYLTERCPHPSCNKVQGWYRTPGVALCDACAEPLTRAVTGTVPQVLRTSLSYAVGMIHPDPERRARSRLELAPALQELTTGQLIELVCALAVVVDPSIRSQRASRRIEFRKSPEKVTAAIAGAWPLLCNWPDGLLALMSDRINRNVTTGKDGNYGASLKFIKLARSLETSSAVSDVIAQFVKERRVAVGAGYSMERAVRLTGSTGEGLLESRRAGDLPMVLGYNGRYLLPLMERAAIDQIAAARAPRERPMKAAGQLGIPLYALEELVLSGRIQTAEAPPGRKATTNISKPSLKAFTEALLARVAVREPRGWIAVSDAMMHFGGRLKPWAAVLSAIYDGQLEVGWRESRKSRLPRLTQHLMIPRARLEELRRLRVPLSDVELRSLTLGEAADIMNVPVDVVRQIFGLPVEQYPECEFDVQSVLKAAARFISVREITIRTGIMPLRFPGIARKRSVPRITKGVYCRASAERMIPLLKRSSD